MDYWKEEIREQAKEIIKDYFHIESNDTNSYDWTAGCYCNHVWMSPKVLLNCMEDFIENNEYIFEEYYTN